MTARHVLTARHLLILLATTAALAACAPAHKDEGEEGAKPSALVTTAVVESQSLSDSLTAFGAVEFAPSAEQTIAAQTDGVVEAVLVSAGAQVSKGAELLRLKPAPQAELDLKKAAADLDVASRAFDRVRRLRTSGLASDGDVETARAAQVTAQALHASLAARINQQRGLRSPADGIVETLTATPGDQVAVGAALMKLGAANGLRVRLGLDAADAARVRVGATVQLSGLNGEVIGAGKITAVEPRIDPQTRLASLIVSVPAPLTPGLSVRGEISLSQSHSASVPRSAVTWEDDGASVFVVDKGVAHKRAIKPGAETPDRIAVTEGLKPGDHVAVAGVAVLEDGMAVRDAKPKADKQP